MPSEQSTAPRPKARINCGFSSFDHRRERYFRGLNGGEESTDSQLSLHLSPCFSNVTLFTEFEACKECNLRTKPLTFPAATCWPATTTARLAFFPIIWILWSSTRISWMRVSRQAFRSWMHAVSNLRRIGAGSCILNAPSNPASSNRHMASPTPEI